MSSFQAHSYRIEITCKEINELNEADHIGFFRDWKIWHHAIVKGIDIGSKMILVFHNTKEGVKKEWLNLHEQNGNLYIFKYPENVTKQNPPSVVLSRAEKRNGENKYDLLTNNCEHFASFCKTGKSDCFQINWLAVASEVAGIKQLCIYVNKANEKKKEESNQHKSEINEKNKENQPNTENKEEKNENNHDKTENRGERSKDDQDKTENRGKNPENDQGKIENREGRNEKDQNKTQNREENNERTELAINIRRQIESVDEIRLFGNLAVDNIELFYDAANEVIQEVRATADTVTAVKEVGKTVGQKIVQEAGEAAGKEGAKKAAKAAGTKVSQEVGKSAGSNAVALGALGIALAFETCHGIYDIYHFERARERGEISNKELNKCITKRVYEGVFSTSFGMAGTIIGGGVLSVPFGILGSLIGKSVGSIAGKAIGNRIC